MSNSQRKKKLAAIKQTEKYLEDQQAKIEIQLEQINEPLNTNFNGKWLVISDLLCLVNLYSVNDPEMMAYFPRIIFYYFLQERDPLLGPCKLSIRIRKIPEEIWWSIRYRNVNGSRPKLFSELVSKCSSIIVSFCFILIISSISCQSSTFDSVTDSLS